MATGDRVDPYKDFRFLVEIDGIVQAGFSECSGFGSDVEVVEYREGGDSATVRKLPGQDELPRHHAQVGPDRFARAVRLAPRRDQRRHRAQERLDHPAGRPRRRGGALELLRGVAEQVGRPGVERDRQRRRRRDADGDLRAARARVRGTRTMLQTEYEFTLPLGLRRPGRGTAPRRYDAPRDGRRRNPAAQGSARARERGVPHRHPAVARRRAARIAAADHAEGGRGAVRRRPGVPAGPLQPHQPRRRAARRCDGPGVARPRRVWSGWRRGGLRLPPDRCSTGR